MLRNAAILLTDVMLKKEDHVESWARVICLPVTSQRICSDFCTSELANIWGVMIKPVDFLTSLRSISLRPQYGQV